MGAQSGCPPHLEDARVGIREGSKAGRQLLQRAEDLAHVVATDGQHGGAGGSGACQCVGVV